MPFKQFIQRFKLILQGSPASSSVYNSCTELPLYNFIKIICTNDLSFLTISGNSTTDELETAWDNISNEYGELSNDTQRTYILGILKEIAINTNKLKIIQALVDQLARHHNVELVARLKRMGFRFKYDPSDWDKYMNELSLTISQSKTLFLRTKQREKDLEDLKTKDSENESSIESDYDVLLSQLSKYQGYRLDPKIVTVSEFLAIVNRFKQDNKPDGKRRQN